MTERRFHVRPEDVHAERLVLRQDEAHHARRVLRLGPGDEVVCFDGRGRAWRGTLGSSTRESVAVEVTEILSAEPAPVPRLTLAQAIAKGDRMDTIVQKATELGVDRLLVLEADHCDVRVDAVRAAKRLDRWCRIVLEASKQSERLWLMDVIEPCAVEHALASLDGSAVAFVERSDARACDVLASLPASADLTVFVGCEGGWSERERQLFVDSGIPRVSLGPTILRTDTAVVAALAIVTYEWRR